MARDEIPPFDLNNTFYQGAPIDVSNLDTTLEGHEYVINDQVRGSGFPVTIRVVRNSASFNLLPKRLVKFDAAFLGARCDGYASTDSQYSFPVYEQAPAGGIPPNDLFYIVVDGPALVKTPLDGGADNVIAVGDNLVSLTAATSGATTAGRVATNPLTGATSILANAIVNKIGRAMSAMTTGNTNSDVLVGIKW